MEHTITISTQVYAALQRQARRSHTPADILAETWLKQHLDLERYPELEWREGPGGWRVGLKNMVIDVYTIVGYSRAGYTSQEIAGELLPQLSPAQAQVALRYYADYPDEIDRILAESEPEAGQAHLYRALGPSGYAQLTGLAEQPLLVRESRPAYPDSEPAGEQD